MSYGTEYAIFTAYSTKTPSNPAAGIILTIQYTEAFYAVFQRTSSVIQEYWCIVAPKEMMKSSYECFFWALEWSNKFCYNTSYSIVCKRKEEDCMIFISGVHGVGKSFLCNMLRERLGISNYSASTLISERRKAGFSADKHVAAIDDNQLYLLEAVDELKAKGKEFLLDGHFCLLDQRGMITRIPMSTFIDLCPDAIILLTEKPQIIAERRRERDGIDHSAVDIQQFQDAEKEYATEIANHIHVPLMISTGICDFENVVDFIQNGRE